MSLFEAVALTIGASVAKSLVKSWLGEGIIQEIVPDLMDLLRDKGIDEVTRRKITPEIEKVGQKVAEHMQLLFTSERADMEESSYEATVREAATTLARANITPDLLVGYQLESDQLARYLLESRPGATRSFSAVETSFYQRMLVEASRSILAIVADLPGFTGSAFAKTLQGQEKILALLAKLADPLDERAVKFEARYCSEVRRILDRLDLLGIPRADQLHRSLSLNITYITLDVEHHLDRQAEVPHPSPDRPPSDTPSSVAIDHILATSRRIAVRGEPGSGKTTLLQWLAIRSAGKDFPPHIADWNRTVPFFIRLRECVNEGFPTPDMFPRLVVPIVAGSMPAEWLTEWVYDQLDRGRALVLVDGIDELPRAQRPAMLERLTELVHAYPLARYVVSSRPTALKEDAWPEWQEWISREDFTDVDLQPMGPRQVENLIDQWYLAVTEILTNLEDRAELKGFPENLKWQLRQRPALRKLATSPLLCAMICALHRERRQQLPVERIKLYEQCCEMLLSGREERRGIPSRHDYPALNEGQRMALVQSFAYWCMTNGWSDVETGEADGHFTQRLALMSVPSDTTGTRVREFFVERSGLLREPIQGRVSFTHRTFQEFLAAQAAAKAGDTGVLIRFAHDDQWHEMIILAAGLFGQKLCEKLLTGLIKRAYRGKRLRHQLLLLAVACLETAVELEGVRAYVLEQAKALFPPKDTNEARAVAAAGDPAIPFLTPNPQYSPSTATACVQALTLIGSQEALTVLADYAQDSPPHVMQELGKGWDAFDRKEYVRQVLAKSKRLILPSLPSLDECTYLTHHTYLRVGAMDPAGLPTLMRWFLPTGFSITTHFFNLYTSSLGFERTLETINAQFGKDNSDENLNPLAALGNLSFLSLMGYTKATDLSSFTNLHKLKELHLIGFRSVTDLSPLRQLAHLEILSLDMCTLLRNLYPITDLSSLTTLRLMANMELHDLSPLASLTNLTSLDLSYCRHVKDLSPLAALTNLTYLTIEGTSVLTSDLASLGRLSKLKIHGRADDAVSVRDMPKE
jgi:hypothetical protein